MRIHHDERGQTIMLVALSLPIILGFVGMATDVGSLFMDKRQMQTAADAGALAGAAALNLASGNITTAARAATAANGYTHGSNGVTVNVNNGPTWPTSEYHLVPNYIEVTVVKAEPTIFLALFGHSNVTVAARAVATNQAPGNGCINLTETNPNVPALAVQGNASVDAPDCDMNINDTNSNAISTTGKAYSVTTSTIGVTATSISAGVGGFTPTPVTGVIPVADPLAAMQYPYTCGAGGCQCPSSSTLCATNPVTSMPATCATTSIGHGTTNLSPGCYNGLSIGSNANVVLAAGTYFFNGDVSVAANGSLSGTGVTLIFTSGAFSMGGTPTMDIVAPLTTSTSDPFPGILYYQVPADTTAMSLGGNSSSTIEGVFYAPTAGNGTNTAGISFQGNPGGTIYTDFVTTSLSLAGNPSFKSFADLPGGAPTGITSIALVE